MPSDDDEEEKASLVCSFTKVVDEIKIYDDDYKLFKKTREVTIKSCSTHSKDLRLTVFKFIISQKQDSTSS